MAEKAAVIGASTAGARSNAEGDLPSSVRPPAHGRARYRKPASIQVLETEKVLSPLSAAEALQVPGVLYAAGDVSLLSAPRRVAIVGSRNASAEGVRRARKLASQLARAGVVVVSGLARGIDAAAHEGALAAGGQTIAVIGTPLDRAYPAEHSVLQERLCREHLVLSQFKVGSRVFPANFVARNRTMALLSHASVIVEAGDTSGSLSQAAETQRLGRPLFFMRSVLENASLQWPAKFQKTGAVILDNVEEMIAALP